MEAEPTRLRRHRRRIPRSRTPILRRLRNDPAALRSWLLIGLLAVALGSVVHRSLADADAARSGWGRRVPVWVTARPVRAGDRLADAFRAERWPAALVPVAAIRTRPTAARARAPLDAGVAITPSMVDPAESAPGRRTVAVPLTDAPLPVRDGDRVDVWATADPATVADDRSATQRVATDAIVVEARERSVVLAIPAAQVRAVADAATTASITLVGAG